MTETNKEKEKRGPGRPKLDRVYITPRVSPKTAEWLRKQAVKTNMTQGEYLEYQLEKEINKKED